MNRLYLLRHAKAAWAGPGMRDFDRPLAASGKADAAALGTVMRERGYRPALTLCSPAVRARETWAAVSQTLGGEPVPTSVCDVLYNGDPSGYLTVFAEAPTPGPLLVVGHNPVMEDLALTLAKDGVPEATARVAAGFPACGLAVLSFAVPFDAIAPRTGHLEAFLVPERR